VTTVLSGPEIAERITGKYPKSIIETGNQSVLIKSEDLLKIADCLKNDPELDFNLLVDITAVDYFDYFEVVYRITSLKNNNSLVLKVRCYNRDKPEVPSVTGIWKGGDFMEREIFDLMGIRFTGHPNMKRIFMWEGFTGHPLRKDFL
jgi:NADH-quinone oxidoreductase subunit C